MKVYTTKTAAETTRLGKSISAKMKKKNVLALEGVYGSGKTTFVRGLARGFGIQRTVRSPSFLLMHEYRIHGKPIKELVHIDLWRTRRLSADDLASLRDVLHRPHAIVVIEWPNRLPRALAKKITTVYSFHITGPRARRITVTRQKPGRVRPSHL